MNASFSINGLLSPAEVAVAWQAVTQYRQGQPKSAAEGNRPETGEIDEATAVLAQRIHRGLTLAPLGTRYQQMFQVWFDAPEGEAVKIEDLSAKVGASIEELRASTSKLSARMHKIATPEEMATLRTPFLLLADLKYDENRMARYTLTPAGREAVRRFLGR